MASSDGIDFRGERLGDADFSNTASIELLRYQVPLPPWVAPKRRGRPPRTARPAPA
jgi:hypothetical protein